MEAIRENMHTKNRYAILDRYIKTNLYQIYKMNLQINLYLKYTLS